MHNTIQNGKVLYAKVVHILKKKFKNSGLSNIPFRLRSHTQDLFIYSLVNVVCACCVYSFATKCDVRLSNELCKSVFYERYDCWFVRLTKVIIVATWRNVQDALFNICQSIECFP